MPPLHVTLLGKELFSGNFQMIPLTPRLEKTPSLSHLRGGQTPEALGPHPGAGEHYQQIEKGNEQIILIICLRRGGKRRPRKMISNKTVDF